MPYNLVAGGGTFDHFHEGHEAFLRAMLLVGDEVLLGITNDEYTKDHKKWPESVQAYSVRKQAVLRFLKKEKVLERVKISKINSLHLPKKWNLMPIQALVVTSDTVSGGEELNRKRRPLPPLDIIVADIVTDSMGHKISSTDIRSGIMQTNGKPYAPSNFGRIELVLLEKHRTLFSRPFGSIYKSVSDIRSLTPTYLTTIGDIVTERCLKSGIHPKLSIIDFRSERQARNVTLSDMGFNGNETLLHVENPAGHISSSLIKQLSQIHEVLVQDKQWVIQVTGEEDLSVVPLILVLPLSWQILYGQPNEGVVLITVTPEIKLKMAELLKKFTIL